MQSCQLVRAKPRWISGGIVAGLDWSWVASILNRRWCAFLIQAVWAVVYVIVPSNATVFYADILEEFLVSQGCEAGKVVNFLYVEKSFLVAGEFDFKHEIRQGLHRNCTGEQGLAVDNLFQ